MTPQKSKNEQRQELSQLIKEFVESGGEVVRVPSGISGNENNNNLFRSSSQFEPKGDRTPLTDVVKTLEERKQQKSTKTNVIKSSKPKKKLIVDDFGDPVRWVWEE